MPRRRARMTEPEWLACTDPSWMLGWLSPIPRRRLNCTNLTRYACACCRRISRLLPDDACRRAVEAAERLAAGAADPADLQAARRQVEAAWPDPTDKSVGGLAAWAACFATFDEDAARRFQDAHDWAGVSSFDKLLAFYKDCAADSAATARAWSRAKTARSRSKRYNAERAAQADFVRDVFGNPFRDGTGG